jgi:hypothetical protein
MLDKALKISTTTCRARTQESQYDHNIYYRPLSSLSPLNKEEQKLQFLLIKQILKPIVTRCGTMLGAYLAGLGIASAQVDSIIIGLTVASGVGIDLLARRYVK